MNLLPKGYPGYIERGDTAYHLQCALCYATVDGTYWNQKKFADDLRKRGWILRKGKWVCPACRNPQS